MILEYFFHEMIPDDTGIVSSKERWAAVISCAQAAGKKVFPPSRVGEEN